MKFAFSLAEEKDNPELQEVFNEVQQEGDIRVSFKRHPNIFHSVGTMGQFNQIMVARDSDTGKIIASGIRSIKKVYVNGKEGSIGYYSGLKIKSNYRSSILFGRGIRQLQVLHQDNRSSAYLITILEGNCAIEKVLTSGRGGLPKAKYLGTYVTYAIDIARSASCLSQKDFEVRQASRENTKEIFDFLNATNANRQFSPYYSTDEFDSEKKLYRNLHAENFYLSYGGGKVRCAIAVWDQSAFKQSMVTGYSRKMKLIKSIYNPASRYFGLAPLPKEGMEIDNVYLYGNAVEESNADVYQQVLAKIICDCYQKGCKYILAGFHERDFLNKVFSNFISAKIRSHLYIINWKDGADFVANLDNRVPYIELATL